MRKSLTSIVLGTGLLSCAAAAQALPEPAAPRQGVRSVVEVRAMDLDVVATKDGAFVEDLRKEEFTVRVDGKPVALDYFARVDAGVLSAPAPGQLSPDLLAEAVRQPEGPPMLERQFLVFYDDEHIRAPEKNRLLESLRGLVERLRRDDWMSLVSYREGKLSVLVPYTTSKEDLLDGAARLEKVLPRGTFWDGEARRQLLDIRRMRGETRRNAIRQWSALIAQRESSTLEELRRAASALSARSGKRLLIYLSGGLELRPGQGLMQELGALLPNLGIPEIEFYERSVGDELRAVVRQANAAGVTVHALDAKGLEADIDTDRTESTLQESARPNTLIGARLQRETLETLSAQTGGTLVANRNVLPDSLDRIYRDSSRYYSLGITLANMDARQPEHRVEVTTSRPGVVVRSRRSYLARSPADALRDWVEMALLTPKVNGEFPVQLAIGPPRTGKGSERLSPFDLSVKIADLTFTEEAGKRKAIVDIAYAAVEDTGAHSKPVIERRTIVVEPDKMADALQQSFPHKGELKSGKGNLRVVVAVRDAASGRVGLASRSLRID